MADHDLQARDLPGPRSGRRLPLDGPGLAGGYAVAGHVRNLPTGEVELVAEGAPEQVDAFLAAVAERMADNIAATTVHDAPPTGAAGFHIRG